MKMRFLKDEYRVRKGDEFYLDSKEQAKYLIDNKIAEMVDEKAEKLVIEGKDTREVVTPDVEYVPKHVDEPKAEEKPTKPIETKKS